MTTKSRFRIGQLVSWPTYSKKCIHVDYIDWCLVAKDFAPDSDAHSPPRYHAVVFELMPNGSALAAYNGRFSPEELASNPTVPVIWLLP
jgi:hypothetical protein